MQLTERFDKKILAFARNQHENTLNENSYITFFNAKTNPITRILVEAKAQG